MYDRRRLLSAIALTYCGIGLALRCALFSVYAPTGSGAVVAVAAVGSGVFLDLLMATVMLAPFTLLLALSGGASLAGPRLRYAVLTLISTTMIFSAAVEWFFFDEFTARFNHIAVDYVLFPGEVFTNIWESYNVPLYSGLALVLGAIAAWPTARWLRDATFTALPIRQRLIGAAAALSASGMAVTSLIYWPAAPFLDRQVSEIAHNGVVQLVRAFATAHLDYDTYYRTLPQDEARGVAQAAVHASTEGDSFTKRFAPSITRERPLDVVLILEESLGSEFIGALGGRKNCTPGFDRWSREGLLCTNLVANGNRTVRGLEGVLCSFVPLPGDSIVKRAKSENVASAARVLKDRGYRTEFFYGGAGTFDNMKPFMTANGWDHFIEDGIVSSDYPADAFRTAWGVADEHIFNRLLEHQQAAHRDGVPFLGTVMSVSNHKPFLTPHSPIPTLSASRLWRWLAIGVGLAATVGLGGWILRRRLGPVRLTACASVILAIYCLMLHMDLQPHDSRSHAVRYSDLALADYLDHAKAAGLLDHTVVMIVGDHGARVYGAEEIPVGSYRIPALFLAPGKPFHHATYDRLCSQVDLLPTALSLAGIDYSAPFLGDDLLSLPPDTPGRAFVNHNREIGILTDDTLVALGLQKRLTVYRRSGRSSDAFSAVAKDQFTATDQELIRQATAVFQSAYALYESRSYVLPDQTPIAIR